MSGEKSFIDRGVEHANAAIRFDRAACKSDGSVELYENAMASYMKAIDYYRAAAKFERNPQTKSVLHNKTVEYLGRAEQMNKWLKSYEEKKKAAEERSGGGAATKARKKTAGPKRPAASSGPNSVAANGVSGPDGPAAGNAGAEEEEEEEVDEEMAKMRGALSGAIVTEKPNVKWADVAGLTGAKNALKEAVIMPKRYPKMFVGKRQPWKGILLYGPPGTGKSYLAKAIATESDAQFFSVSSSDLVSKWQGESEKLVKELFAMARKTGNAIVFIDEIDALVSTRSDSESESSRRIKTEFLVQMDGVGNNTDGVLVLGATNIPWGLDDALLRRMERRVYIPLPDAKGREQMFRLHLGDTPHDLAPADFSYLAAKSEGYSGSDLKIVTRDAIMEPVRMATQATHFKRKRDLATKTDKLIPCSPGDPLAQAMDLMDIDPDDLVLPPITRIHFEMALQNSKPSVGKESLAKHEKFTRETGSEGR
jgi:vacuolar protein-sorting-associated protein 4